MEDRIILSSSSMKNELKEIESKIVSTRQCISALNEVRDKLMKNKLNEADMQR